MVDSCWILNFLNDETQTNFTWMETRDFGNSEYAILKVIGFIYIWSILDFNKSRTTRTKVMKL